MKLLLIYCDKFAYNPKVKTLENAAEINDSKEFKKIQTAFIQVEESDESEEREKAVFKKLIKNLKWIVKKNNTNKIILHSFAHLSESKASPEFTKSILNRVQKKMENAGNEVFQTPFGYFLDLDMQAPGFSLARVFKDL